MTIQTGTFKRTETLIENTHFGPSEYRFTKEFRIEEKSYNGKPAKLFQTEITWHNSVQTCRSQYLANTGYAKERRDWVCDF